MTARDVIADTLRKAAGTGESSEMKARWISEALTAAGYSIVHESEIHGATKRRCAAVAYSDPDYVGGGFPQRDDEGLLYPVSTYDRGRYDARKAIISIDGGATNG